MDNSKKKRLNNFTRLILFSLILTIPFIVFYISIYNQEQTRNMRAVDQWINDNQTAIDQFQATHEIQFRIWSQTRANGCVGMQLEVESTEQLNQINDFLQSISPPRSIDWHVTCDGEFYYRYGELPELKPTNKEE